MGENYEFKQTIRHRVRLDWAYFCWNWKHCSEIFFKYVNSTVGPIFNKKIVKSGICGFVNNAQMHCSHEKVHIYGCTVTDHSWNARKQKTKKKKKKGRCLLCYCSVGPMRKTQTRISKKTSSPNALIVTKTKTMPLYSVTATKPQVIYHFCFVTPKR